MSNKIGNIVQFTIFGESHGSHIGFVLEGLPAGIKIDEEFINLQLSKRRPQGKNETARVENDKYMIVSGVYNNYTTGSPICFLIENSNTRSSDYEKTKYLARPSHADYVSYVKYGGYSDYRGGGHFSGRITAAIVAAGAIVIPFLKSKGIEIATHIKTIKNINDKDFVKEGVTLQDVRNINDKSFPVLNDVESDMIKTIDEVRMDNDSIGGITQTAILGLNPGFGEPWFDSIEGTLSKAIFAIGGVKGIEFGSGFAFKDITGKVANDEIYNDNGVIKTLSNNNGGINGGISNGMPIIFNSAIKPTPSIYTKQRTINLESLENEELLINGRHDPAIIRRICIVITSITALVLADIIAGGNKNYIE